MSFILTKQTKFTIECGSSPTVAHAARILRRDFEAVFSAHMRETNNGDVTFQIDETIGAAERFEITVSEHLIRISCNDELALMYAVLYFSREYLGVDDFWIWTEKKPKKTNRISIDEGEYISPTARVRYRGWFVNDEVCLIGWSGVYPPSRQVWESVFETLLRLGGNMVIPGTDLPRNGGHFEIASEMGLYITHHHAEPLGAEMFLRAYPDKEPSYDTNAELFEKLWIDAIEKNKDKKIIWTLGFRGQGDTPFWMNDQKYKTPESRAEVIRRVIDRQYALLCERVTNPVCAVYLYGEITELYEQGYLTLPDEFIKIWSDNGYGKMVVRRRGTHNPRTPSLPHGAGSHGVYYHATFHDLQASSHLSLLANPPEFVNSELDAALDARGDAYWLINCGNIRPHVYMLDLAARKWRYGAADIQEFKKDFARRYFEGAQKRALECCDEYFNCCIKYGENTDDRAGDEFYFHTARAVITSWAKGAESASELVWLTGEKSMAEQVHHISAMCDGAIERFSKLEKKCADVRASLKRPAFFRDNLYFQVRLHLAGARGLLCLCKAYDAFTGGKQDSLPKSFVLLNDAINEFTNGVRLLEESERGAWTGFYSADWLTNVRVTVEETIALRKYVRLLGDAPDYFRWFKNYIIPETERNIYLENTQRRTLDDDELAERLREVL